MQPTDNNNQGQVPATSVTDTPATVADPGMGGVATPAPTDQPAAWTPEPTATPVAPATDTPAAETPAVDPNAPQGGTV